jgi:GH35 family endo-1,4-beta-xylanase
MEQEFFLDTNATKSGIYLSQQQIDLLFIISCESKAQLEEYFYRMCGQFPYQKIEEVIPNYNDLDIEQSKRVLFEKYKDVLIGYKENHRMSPQEQALHKLNMMRTPDGKPIPEEVKQDVLTMVQKDGIDAGLKHLTNLYGHEFIQRFNRLMKDDFENIKSISYEDMQALHERIKNDPNLDTIIIATSKYDNTVYSDGEKTYYDPYLTAKGLTYCKMNGKHMRFHALFDYAHLMKLVREGKGPEDKEEILQDMKNYVRASFEYIEKYNESVRGTNEPTINVVEIFNELVEYNLQDGVPYEMAWEKYFGITIDDILSCFEGIKKPDGVEFMYNETQLEESPDRRRKVSETFTEIMKKRPDLIDVFGNQMHLQHTHADEKGAKPSETLEAVRSSLSLMKQFEDTEYPLPDGTTKKVRTEITEFDIHVTKETYFDKVVPMLASKDLTEDEIIILRKNWLDRISEAIRESGINPERITYWSMHDTVDHNLIRANLAILDANPDKSIEDLEREHLLVDTLYAGALGTGVEETKSLPESAPALDSTAVEERQEEVLVPQEETPIEELQKDKPKTLSLKPPKIPNSGFITEYIILGVVLTILIVLVILTIISIT